ncbi:hypothetical protein [Rhodovarius lipocyclicus]|uniref:hypothetical protein n=1 Tax=Rhodovarius lipocyclicus TaxID=268410 RepID=UPI001357D1ED|nr:hypothetical protein [Rhodovarius lipocyclicus]
MGEFSSVRTVTAAKQHVCEECRQPILKGERHHYLAFKYDGDFNTLRSHVECSEARVAYMRDNDIDEAGFLIDEWESSGEPMENMGFPPIVEARLRQTEADRAARQAAQAVKP